MIGHTQAKSPISRTWLTRAPQREWATIAALDLLASLTLFAMKAPSDHFQMIRWFTLLLLAQPGLLMTWVMVQQSLKRLQSGVASKASAMAVVFRICAAFMVLVIILPAIVELWFWV